MPCPLCNPCDDTDPSRMPPDFVEYIWTDTEH
jgi:hypothetical protein